VPSDSRVAAGRWLTEDNLNEEYMTRARGLNEIAQGRGQTLAQLALTWVLRIPQVTSALIGASSVAQLNDNFAALDAPALTEAEISTIDEFAVHGTGSRR
jgi:L-glyceraldehyde 3-phosphate reductase